MPRTAIEDRVGLGEHVLYVREHLRVLRLQLRHRCLFVKHAAEVRQPAAFIVAALYVCCRWIQRRWLKHTCSSAAFGCTQPLAHRPGAGEGARTRNVDAPNK